MMRTLLTIILLIVWIPVAFALTGFGESVVTGESNGLSPLGWLLAISLWIAGSILIVQLRRQHRAMA